MPDYDYVGEQFGEYRLIRKLGGGSFGNVYLGEHIRDNTSAAVKVLHMRMHHNDDLTDFINEARVLFRLQHPNIVPLIDFGIERGVSFLIMAYAVKGILRQPKGTRLPLDTIVVYVKQIAEALQYAHDRKLVHRDVKPDNILLASDSRIWLSDFGIASIAHSSRSLHTKDRAGTAPYMAPEQILGKPRPASDQYALGIITYEWICGSRPFNGTAIEIALQHAQAVPSSLCELVPTLPRAVEQVVLKSLAKEPQERFGSVREFAEALSLVISDSSAHVPKPHASVHQTSTQVSKSEVHAQIFDAMKDMYNAVREGRVVDIQVILGLAARFEDIAKDPEASEEFNYDAAAAAHNLYKRARALNIVYGNLK